MGDTTRTALDTFARTGEPYSGSPCPNSAGNGSIMRLAPIPLRYRAAPAQALEFARKSPRTTHGAPAPLDACHYLTGLIVGALEGRAKNELLAPHFSPIVSDSGITRYATDVAEIAAGSFKRKQPPEICGNGCVVQSLEAALWAFYSTDTFGDGALLAVNLGDDADTTGAVYGPLAGAHYGVQRIPQGWLQTLTERRLVEESADALMDASRS